MTDSLVNDTVQCFLVDDYVAIDPELPDVLRMLARRNAAKNWHKHGTFKDHLLGVYRILKLWNQSTETCMCGLLHSVYSNEYVNLALFDVNTERDTMRDIVGSDVEELVYLFCTMPRSEFAIELMNAQKVTADGLVLRGLPSGSVCSLSRKQVAIFLVVTLADLAEQWFSWQDEVMAGYPNSMQRSTKEWWSAALWPGPLRPSSANLCLLSRIARHLPSLDIEVPPIFNCCTQVLSKSDESSASSLYWQVVNQNPSIASRDEAKAHLLAALEHNRWLPEPNLLLAQLCLIDGDYNAAERHAFRGLQLLIEWGTPWDKRIPWAGWVAWARLLVQNARNRTWPQTLREHNNLGLVGSR